MSVIDDFAAIVENTDIMKQVRRSLREEPAFLLRDICREFKETGKPVPDHHLQYAGYMGESAMKALISAGLVKKKSGGAVSLWAYEPTTEGLAQYEKLAADGFYEKVKTVEIA